MRRGSLGRISATDGSGITSINQLLDKHGFVRLGRDCVSNAQCTPPAACVGGSCSVATANRIRQCP